MNNPAYGEGVYSIYQLMIINNYYNLSIVVLVHDDSSNVQTDVNPAYETSTAVNNTVLYETVFL